MLHLIVTPSRAASLDRRRCHRARPLAYLVAALALVLGACGPDLEGESGQEQGAATALPLTAALTAARVGHTATLLLDGRVLVVGGTAASGLLASAELYDPATGAWAPTGALAQARYGHTATRLANGTVLVVGGFGTARLATAQVYDPATGVWTATGALTTARYLHTATLLGNGKVLVVGGSASTGSVATAQLYDPATGIWADTGALPAARHSHTAILQSPVSVWSQVYVVGGTGASGILSTAEVYDPALGVWSGTGSLNQARRGHTATPLSNGRVLVVGGENGTSPYLASAELY